MLSFAASNFSGARRSLVALLLVASPLAACDGQYDQMATSAIPNDYHQRHPIVLANAPNRLDVFLVGAGGKLDDAQNQNVGRFAAEYLTHGHGTIHVLLPMIQDQRAVRATFDDVRRRLAQSGVRGSLIVSRYSVVDPRLASPIQLSFLELQANVATKCGEWPQDLAYGSSTAGWENKQYYNFGCATQKDFAMQVADPRDLVRPRAESPSDVAMRLRAIGNIEQGTDPGTAWVTNNTAISSVGAN